MQMAPVDRASNEPPKSDDEKNDIEGEDYQNRAWRNIKLCLLFFYQF